MGKVSKQNISYPPGSIPGEGILFTQSGVEGLLSSLERKGRQKGTVDWYRHGLRYLYEYLPEEKLIYKNTLHDWREELLKKGYALQTINHFVTAANAYLNHVGAREYQLVGQLKAEAELQPELSRGEYLRLLQTARALGRERVYLLVKLFATTEIPVQELAKVTVEALEKGRVDVCSSGIKHIVRIPGCLQKELRSYAGRSGILSGPVFLSRDGEPMSRTNVSSRIRQLCIAARVPEEKGNPRCLKRLYQSTQENIERNIALLVEQAQERLLEEEQLSIGWEEA